MKHNLVSYLLFFVVVWFGVCVSAGQDRVVLDGYVRDTAGGPVPYATVALWQIPDGSGMISVDQAVAEGWAMAGGCVSDTNGYYRVDNLMQARYLLQCKHLIYETAFAEVEAVAGQGFTVKDFVLYPKSGLLEEVEIKGSRLRYTAGAYTVNLSEAEIVRNRTVSEVLNFLPGLTYKDEKLLLDGREVAIVYLDGRELKDRERLRWLNGEDIEAVEVQNQAGSAHSSALKGGIVRIRTKRKEGYSLDLILNPYYTPEKSMMYGGSFVAPFSFRKGKFSLTNDASYRHHTGDAIEYEDATYFSEAYRLETERHARLRYHVFRDYLSMVYDVDAETSVGLVGVVFYNASKNRVRSVSTPETLLGHHPAGLGYERSVYSSDEDANTLSSLVAVDFARTFDTLGSRLSVKADYLYNSVRRNTRYRTAWLGAAAAGAEEAALLGEEVYRQDVPLTENNATARLDYRHGFRPGRGLEVGLTYDGNFASDAFRTEVVRDGDWQDDPERGERYGIQTNHATAYAIYRDRYGKFAYSVGASVQWDGIYAKDALGNPFSERNYVQPFANLSFGYDFNAQMGTSLSLDLSRYSGRMPTYRQLSPHPVRLSATSYMVGNEALRLPDGYRGQLTYMLRGAWRFTYSFSAAKGAIYNITSYDPATGISCQQPQNGSWEYEHELSVNWEKEVARWLYMGLEGRALYMDQSYRDATGYYRHKAVLGIVSANLNFQVLPSMGIGLELFYVTPVSFIDEYANHDLTGSLSLYKTFFGGRLYLSVAGYFRGWDGVVKTRELDGSYKATVRYYNPVVQNLYLTVRWRFSRNPQGVRKVQTVQRIAD